MANKFDNPTKALGACEEWVPNCTLVGDKDFCIQQCDLDGLPQRKGFQSASGKSASRIGLPEMCPCMMPRQEGLTCEETCSGVGDGVANQTAGKARRGMTPTPCPCGALSLQGGSDCPRLCGDYNPYSKASGSGRTIRVSSPRANANFMMATGRGKAMSDFLHEVGIIVIGFAAFTYIAAPIFKKVGIKPINV